MARPGVEKWLVMGAFGLVSALKAADRALARTTPAQRDEEAFRAWVAGGASPT